MVIVQYLAKLFTPDLMRNYPLPVNELPDNLNVLDLGYEQLVTFI